MTAALVILGFLARDLLTRPGPRNVLGPGFSWPLVVLAGGLDLALFLFAVNFARRTRLVHSFRVEVFPEGVLITDHKGCDLFGWATTVQFVEEKIQEYLPGLGLDFGVSINLPSGKSRYITIVRADGLQYTLGTELVKGLGRLARILQQEARSRDIPWSVKIIDPGPIQYPFKGLGQS